MVPSRDFVHAQALWVVGRGNMKVWGNNWMGDRVEYTEGWDPELTVAQLLASQALIQNLKLLVDGRAQAKIDNIFLDDSKDDDMVWSLSNDGKFSSKSCWEAMRRPGNRSTLCSNIWYKLLPLKVSIFLWKLLKGAVAVDTKIQSIHIPLVSRCHCCANPSIENEEHLFIHSDIAQYLWKALELLLNFRPLSSSILGVYAAAFSKSSHSNQLSLLQFLAVAYSLWEIWKFRNERVHEFCPLNPKKVLHKVLHQAGLSQHGFRPWTRLSFHDQTCVLAVSLRINPCRILRGKWVSWTPPNPGTVKLNIDGSCIEGLAAGGGLARDSEGNILFAFAAFFGHGTNTIAEVRALLEGLKLCVQAGYSNVYIESDYLYTVNVVNKSFRGFHSIAYDTRRIHRILDRLATWRVDHIYREGNQPADFMSKWGNANRQFQVFYAPDVPAGCKDLCLRDKRGLASYRASKQISFL